MNPGAIAREASVCAALFTCAVAVAVVAGCGCWCDGHERYKVPRAGEYDVIGLGYGGQAGDGFSLTHVTYDADNASVEVGYVSPADRQEYLAVYGVVGVDLHDTEE